MIQILLTVAIAAIVLSTALWGKEGFRNPSAASASSVVVVDSSPDSEDDPQDLPWIASWSAMDRAARANQTCVRLKSMPGPAGTVIQICNDSCEDGLPHTRDADRILIPKSLDPAIWADTICHEMCHIWQRRKPDLWKAFYRSAWGMEIGETPPPEMPAELKTNRRSNPDTWMHPWVVWQNRWWIVCVYSTPGRPSLRKSQVIWWDSKTQTAQTTPPPEWTAFFGSPGQTEHPHELSACYIATNNNQCEAGRRVLNWAKGQGFIHPKQEVYEFIGNGGAHVSN